MSPVFGWFVEVGRTSSKGLAVTGKKLTHHLDKVGVVSLKLDGY